MLEYVGSNRHVVLEQSADLLQDLEVLQDDIAELSVNDVGFVGDVVRAQEVDVLLQDLLEDYVVDGGKVLLRVGVRSLR